MYKILVFGMTENPGGVESVIMNYYHYMDKNTFHFDFYVIHIIKSLSKKKLFPMVHKPFIFLREVKIIKNTKKN